MVGHGKCRRVGHGRLILLGHSGPLSLGVLGGSPETYHPVGLGRGTATSSSTRPGTTSWIGSAPDRSPISSASLSRGSISSPARGLLPCVRHDGNYYFRRPQLEVVANARRTRWHSLPSQRLPKSVTVP